MYGRPSVSSHDLQYSSISSESPALSTLGTPKYKTTRFHACERKWKCAHARGDQEGCFESAEHRAMWEKTNAKALAEDNLLKEQGLLPMLVFVNPAEAAHHGWRRYSESMKAKCTAARTGKGQYPTNLVRRLHHFLPLYML